MKIKTRILWPLLRMSLLALVGALAVNRLQVAAMIAAAKEADNGIGILPENLTRIFGHGFTARKDGHGFGLHSAARSAKEMGGSLSVHSEGADQGATFTLELPLLSPEVSHG